MPITPFPHPCLALAFTAPPADDPDGAPALTMELRHGLRTTQHGWDLLDWRHPANRDGMRALAARDLTAYLGSHPEARVIVADAARWRDQWHRYRLITSMPVPVEILRPICLRSLGAAWRLALGEPGPATLRQLCHHCGYPYQPSAHVRACAIASCYQHILGHWAGAPEVAA